MSNFSDIDKIMKVIYNINIRYIYYYYVLGGVNMKKVDNRVRSSVTIESMINTMMPLPLKNSPCGDNIYEKGKALANSLNGNEALTCDIHQSNSFCERCWN